MSDLKAQIKHELSKRFSNIRETDSEFRINAPLLNREDLECVSNTLKLGTFDFNIKRSGTGVVLLIR